MAETPKFKRNLSPEERDRRRVVALANLEKARKSGRLGKHGKHSTTLLKENVEKELRDNLIAALMPFIPDLTYEVLFQALHGDTKTAQYLFNQLIGKPKETVESTGNPEGMKSIESNVREILNRQQQV